VPEFDREALISSLKNRRPPICERIEARRIVQPERAAIARQNRQEKLRILEEAVQKLTGANLRELRTSLARNRQQRDEALAALRSRIAPPNPTESTAAGSASSMFRSLKPLAGRLVPLAQPSFAFLDAPYSFDKYETGNWLWNSSIAPGGVFFQTNIYATQGSDYAVYTFRYVWNNDSDSAMLTTVFAGLSFTGYLFASAQDGNAQMCWDATVHAYLDATLDLGTPDNPSMESKTSRFGSITADDGFWGLGDGLADQIYSNQDYSISFEGFLVQPNSALIISVSTAFSFSWDFDTPVSIGNYAQADFGENLFPSNRVASNGVVVFASPLTIM
jgi:hypothetical protein